MHVSGEDLLEEGPGRGGGRAGDQGTGIWSVERQRQGWAWGGENSDLGTYKNDKGRRDGQDYIRLGHANGLTRARGARERSCGYTRRRKRYSGTVRATYTTESWIDRCRSKVPKYMPSTSRQPCNQVTRYFVPDPSPLTLAAIVCGRLKVDPPRDWTQKEEERGCQSGAAKRPWFSQAAAFLWRLFGSLCRAEFELSHGDVPCPWSNSTRLELCCCMVPYQYSVSSMKFGNGMPVLGRTRGYW